MGLRTNTFHEFVEVAFMRQIGFEAFFADSSFLAASADFRRIPASDFALLNRIAVPRAIPEEAEHWHESGYRSIGAAHYERSVTVSP
jgi:hypothetical protein